MKASVVRLRLKEFVMAFDLDEARRRLGIADGDTSQDALITLTLATALSVAETYCNRKFAYAAEEDQTFLRHSGRSLPLWRYPVEKVDWLERIAAGMDSQTAPGTSLPQTTRFDLDRRLGYIFLLEQGWEATYRIRYSGGFKELPFDLELALWGIFTALWPTMSSTIGSGATVGSGEVASISVPDVGTIRFNTSNGDVSGGVGSGAGGMYGPFYTVLDQYKRLHV
jgi:hypothetical protein